jgi:hypothetical protein
MKIYDTVQAKVSFLSASQEERSYGFWLSVWMGPFFLGAVLAFPTGIAGWFDGLPWAGSVETLVLSVLLPFLAFMGYRFLFLRWSIIFLSALLVLKIIMFVGAPASGWQVKVYPDMTLDEVRQNMWDKEMYETVTSGKWVKTYATRWIGNFSGIFQSPWTQKTQFPIDWFQPSGVAEKNEKEQFDAIHPWINYEGAVILPPGSSLVIVARGVADGALMFLDSTGEKVVVPLAKDYQEARELALHAPTGGSGSVSGKLRFKGKEWSFIPVLVDVNGTVSSSLGRSVLWQYPSALSTSSGKIPFYVFLSWIADIGVSLFFITWGIWATRFLVQEEILSSSLAIFSAVVIILTFVMAPFFTFMIETFYFIDPSKVTNLGFSVVIVSVGFLLWVCWRDDYRSFRSKQIGATVFLLFGPATLIFFSNKWFPQMEQWSLWSQGDDWTSYQNFAYKIVVDGEWLSAGEGVFMMQPLYRYFVGFYHLLFGQSAFVQRMADVWCILGAATLIACLIVRFRLPALIAFLASIAYLMANLIGTFRYRIGEGLVENHAMIFMMLAAWFLYRSCEGAGYYRIILATLFGIIGYWMRQDHLGAIAGLAFLALEPVEGLTGGWQEYWERFKLHWQRIALYWGGGILSVLLICYRNWFLGGPFFPADTRHPSFIGEFERGKFYLILTGDEWPAFPSISGIVVTLGVFVALLALVWRPKFLSNFPLSLGVVFIGLLAPYIFLWTGSYEPRFSIHILPLAILSCAFLLNNIFKNNNLLQRSGWRGN